MFFKYFIDNLSEEEYAFLYGYVYTVILKSSNFECAPDYVKFLKPSHTKAYIEKMKPKMLPEKQYVADSLLSKIDNYLNNL